MIIYFCDMFSFLCVIVIFYFSFLKYILVIDVDKMLMSIVLWWAVLIFVKEVDWVSGTSFGGSLCLSPKQRIYMNVAGAFLFSLILIVFVQFIFHYQIPIGMLFCSF